MSTDSLATRRSKRPYVLAALGVVLLILVGIWVAGRAWANGKADDYATDLASWQSKDGATLLKSTADLPDGTFLLKDMTTKKGLATQRTACSAVESAAQNVPKLAGSLPTVSSGVAGVFSGRLRGAARTSERREAVVERLAKRASAVYGQIHTDCVWNVAYNDDAPGRKRARQLEKKAFTYLDRRGDVTGTQVCDSDICIPAKKSRRLKYAEYLAKSRAAEYAAIKSHLTQGCSDTSLGAGMCREMLAFRTGLKKARDRYTAAVRALPSALDTSSLVRVDRARERAVDDGFAGLLRELKASHPDLAKDAKLRKDPGFSDRFFLLSNRNAVAGLAKDRRAVADL